jgi:hypothetical protein
MYLDYIISIINISNSYSIPNDISKIIYKLFIDKSASIIQKIWFNYVIIHNSNLCHIINQLKVIRVSNPNFTIIDYYYNLNDIRVLYSFKICLKYFKPNISDKSWWLNKLHILNQSLLYECFNINNELYFQYTYIYSLFFYKLKKKHKNIL